MARILFNHENPRCDVNPPWTINQGIWQVTPNTHESISSKYYLQAVSGGLCSISTASSKAVGVWQYRFKKTADYNEFWFVSKNEGRWMWAGQGYLLWYNKDKLADRLPGLVLSRSDGASGKDLSSYRHFVVNNEWAQIKIRREADGFIQVFMDGVNIINAVDTTYDSSLYVHIATDSSILSGFTDIIYEPL